MKQINDETYINPDNVVLIEELDNKYFLISSSGNRIYIPKSLYDELKDYEGGSGSSGPQMLITSTDATLDNDVYTLDLQYLSTTPNVDDYIGYVEDDTIKTLYKVTTVDNIEATLEKIGDVGGGSSNIAFENVAVATTDFTASVAYNDYPYEAIVVTDSSLIGIVAQGGFVTFDIVEANSSNYSSVAYLDEINGTITIYAKEIPSANFTIPSIVIYR